jgi:hypothetical protein
MNYEETLLEMDSTFQQLNLPVRYMNVRMQKRELASVGIIDHEFQIDSWWYFKGDDNGVKNWTAMPDVFPNGLAPIHQATGWTFAAHNRYWAPDTDYATQNGGQFQFYVETDSRRALPRDLELWRHLFETSLEWGLEVYEQDWQDRQFVEMK